MGGVWGGSGQSLTADIQTLFLNPVLRRNLQDPQEAPDPHLTWSSYFTDGETEVAGRKWLEQVIHSGPRELRFECMSLCFKCLNSSIYTDVCVCARVYVYMCVTY